MGGLVVENYRCHNISNVMGSGGMRRSMMMSMMMSRGGRGGVEEGGEEAEDEEEEQEDGEWEKEQEEEVEEVVKEEEEEEEMVEEEVGEEVEETLYRPDDNSDAVYTTDNISLHNEWGVYVEVMGLRALYVGNRRDQPMP